MATVEVKAKDLEPGDILCDDDRLNPAEWKSAIIITLAVISVIDNKRKRYASRTRAEHVALSEEIRRVEHVSYGPFKARIVLGNGSIVRVRRNAIVAVYRGRDSYL